MNSNPTSRKIWIGLAVACSLLVIGLTVFIMYQVAAVYVAAFGPKGEHYDRGVAFLAKGKYVAALAEAELSIKAHENKAESNLLRANALYALDRPGEAVADLQLVAKVRPTLASELHCQAERLAEEDGAPTDVVRLESLAIAIAPFHSSCYIGRSHAYTELDLYQKAIDDCTTALAMTYLDAEDTISLRLNRAAAYNGAHRYNEALADSEQALRIKDVTDNVRWPVLNVKVNALLGLKKYKDALAACDLGIEQASDEKEWVVAFKDLKIDILKARNDKVLKDPEQVTKLKDECQRLNASIEADEKAEADKIREESGGD